MMATSIDVSDAWAMCSQCVCIKDWWADLGLCARATIKPISRPLLVVGITGFPELIRGDIIGFWQHIMVYKRHRTELLPWI